jgi:hypothetical protein
VAAGFTSGSLQLPRDPKSLLLEFRAYFALNTAHESASNGVTAAQANTLALAIDAAFLAEAQANTARDAAVEARDASFNRLRSRIVGLRGELEQILEPDDMRWRTFGFARPIDRRIPKLVTGLTVRAGTVAGEIIVEWDPAIGAENYRVLRQVQTVDLAPVEVGLFSDRTVIINGLPSGKTVIVSVTAAIPRVKRCRPTARSLSPNLQTRQRRESRSAKIKNASGVMNAGRGFLSGGDLTTAERSEPNGMNGVERHSLYDLCSLKGMRGGAWQMAFQR